VKDVDGNYTWKALGVLALAVYGAVQLWWDVGGPALLGAILDPIGRAVPHWGSILGWAILVLAVLGQLVALAAWWANRHAN
jgi:hypothetical protein